MDIELKRFQIFRTGTHRDSKGVVLTFSQDSVQAIAHEYNSRQTGKAPLYIGHPTQTGRKEAKGVIGSLFMLDNKLYAYAYVTEEMISLVKQGMYKHVSAGLVSDGKGGWKLDHVAFLNNPAVKGMDALEFAESENGIEMQFLQQADFSDGFPPLAWQNPNTPLSKAATEYAKLYKVDYRTAVCEIIRERELTPFLNIEARTSHQKIMQRRAYLGGTYEENVAAISQDMNLYKLIHE